MGMFTLIIGGSKSGKSGYAENIIQSFEGKKLYVATMMPIGEEAHRAIKRHRLMRENKGFETVEKYTSVGEIADCRDIGDAVILLECMGNLCANEMFSDVNCRLDVAAQIVSDIKMLAAKAKALVVVSNKVSEDGINYPAETKAYIKNMGIINARLAEVADSVIETVYGMAVVVK